MAAPHAVRPLGGPAHVPLAKPLQGEAIKEFFFEIGREIYLDPPHDNPLPTLKNWSWENNLSLLNYNIVPINWGQMPDRLMAMRSITGRLKAIAVKIFPFHNSFACIIKVYVISGRFNECYKFDPEHTFVVTKSLSSDDMKFVREHLLHPVYLRR